MPELTPVELVGYEDDEAGSPLALRQWVVHNGHVLIRKKAADLQIGESIYLTGQKDYEILNISKNKDKKLRIALKDYGDLTVDKNEFFNVIDGGYFKKDWVSENEESAE